MSKFRSIFTCHCVSNKLCVKSSSTQLVTGDPPSILPKCRPLQHVCLRKLVLPLTAAAIPKKNYVRYGTRQAVFPSNPDLMQTTLFGEIVKRQAGETPPHTMSLKHKLPVVESTTLCLAPHTLGSEYYESSKRSRNICLPPPMPTSPVVVHCETQRGNKAKARQTNQYHPGQLPFQEKGITTVKLLYPKGTGCKGQGGLNCLFLLLGVGIAYTIGGKRKFVLKTMARMVYIYITVGV